MKSLSSYNVKIRIKSLTYVKIRSIINPKTGKKDIKYSELEKKLKAAGCTIYKEGAGHTIWYSPKIGKKFPVGRRKTEDVKTGTLKSILRDAGLI